MEPVTLNDLLKKAQPYEDLAVPFSPALRRSAQLSTAAIMIATIVYWLLPSSPSVTGSSFYLVLGDRLASMINIVQAALPYLQTLNAVSVMLSGLLIMLTNRFVKGRELLHWLTFGVVLVGLVNTVVVIMLSGVLIINLFLWGTIIAVVVFAIWVLVRVLH